MTAAGVRDQTDVELELLLEAIYRRYHYDFRNYARASLHRGVAAAQASLGSPTVTHLLDRIVHEPRAFTELLRYLTVQTSELFRDPAFYRALREDVMPRLATYPSIRVWVAGCGAGEEAYSIAILLAEEGLLERSLIYATDIDAASLAIASAGICDLRRVQAFSENYLQAGGRALLSEHYVAGHAQAVFSERLRKHLLVSDHSLATDAAFAEVHLVTCRNVLIYFDRELQDRSLGLFRESLCPRGFLALGSKETLAFSRHAEAFDPLVPDERIYRKR